MQPTETFDGRPGTTALARRAAAAFVRTVEGATGRPAGGTGTEDLLPVASELVANACRHAPGPCSLLLRRQPGRMEVTVPDRWEAEPTPRTPDPAPGTGHRAPGTGDGFGRPPVSRPAGSMRITHPAPGGKCIRVAMPDW